MYFIKQIDIATSKLYHKDDDDNRWYYWYDKEKKFYFMNTSNWNKIENAKTFWSGDDLDEAKRQVIIYSSFLLQEQVKRLYEIEETIYIIYIQQILLHIENKNLTDAIESFSQIRRASWIIDKLVNVEKSIENALKDINEGKS